MRVLTPLLAAASLLLASAAPVHSTAAVPHYSPQAVVHSLQQHWQVPQSARFADSARQLPPAIQAVCQQPGHAAALQTARQHWASTMQAWGVYSGVPLGPLIERRALRQIDFTPARPALIQRHMAKPPADMTSVGGPAKGLPALEWLLWQGAISSQPAACAWALQVAQDLTQQAAQLAQDSLTAAHTMPATPEAAAASLAEWLNQWAGSIERLRWASIDKPRRQTHPGTPPAWPRATSGHTAAAWAAHWQALHSLAVSPANPPAGGQASAQAPISIQTYLHSRGHMALARRWAQRIASADAAMRALNPRHPATLDKAVRELTQTQHLLTAEIAPALEVRMDFSDADGD